MTLVADFSLTLGSLRLAVAFAARPGETVVLMGPNGAGKTTCLRALAGLVPLGSGTVTLGGRVLDDAAQGVHVLPEARGIGFVFQDYLLFEHLSAQENVAFGLRARGIAKGAARAKAAEWLERFGLAGLANARPRALSGGQAQRVALARALVTEPALLLLDEPMAALDAPLRIAMRRELRARLSAFEGVRVVVTHDAVEALTLADRLIVLEAGVVVQQGTVAEVCERPRSRYVAELVGLNLFRGVAQGGRIELAQGGVLVVASAAQGQVFATVHPRAVALFRARPDGTPRNVWECRVDGIEALGDRVRVQLSGVVPIVAEVTPAAVADLRLGEGGSVFAAVKATEIAVWEA